MHNGVKMLERVYDTIKGILYNDLPKNGANQAIVYDRPITNWYLGDRDIIPSSMSVVLYGSTVGPKDKAYGLKEYEHRIQIACYAGNDNQETTERVVQEMARLVKEILLPHRRIWVLELCPFDGLFALSPQHYSIAHNSIILPYITQAQNNFNTAWGLTHTGTPPTLEDSRLAAEAVRLMFLDVAGDNTPSGMNANTLNNIQTMLRDKVQPIRLLYDCYVQDLKPSNDGRGEQLLKNANFTLVAKEIQYQPDYGPDNVPTTAF